MSDHSIEYHKTWAVFFALLVIVVGIASTIGIFVSQHETMAQLKYRDAQNIACIQSNRSAADCRTIVFGVR